MLVLDNLAYASVDKELTASVSMAETAGRAQLGIRGMAAQQFGHSWADMTGRTRQFGHCRADMTGRTRQGRYGWADVAVRTMQFHQSVTAT